MQSALAISITILLNPKNVSRRKWLQSADCNVVTTQQDRGSCREIPPVGI